MVRGVGVVALEGVGEECTPSSDGDPVDGVGEGRKRLAIPDTMIPG